MVYHKDPVGGDRPANSQLQYLQTGEIDVALAGYFTTLRRFSTVDMIPYSFETIKCCAPNIKILKNQGSALHVFTCNLDSYLSHIHNFIFPHLEVKQSNNQ